jgi:hypothetical protein
LGTPEAEEGSVMNIPRNTGTDADDIAETEADHFGHCQDRE